jgi:hypothetical protein
MNIDFAKPQTASNKQSWLLPLAAIAVFAFTGFELLESLRKRDSAISELNIASQKANKLRTSSDRENSQLDKSKDSARIIPNPIDFGQFMQLLEIVPRSSITIADAQYDQTKQRIELRVYAKSIGSVLSWIAHIKSQLQLEVELLSTKKVSNENHATVEALVATKKDLTIGKTQ